MQNKATPKAKIAFLTAILLLSLALPLLLTGVAISQEMEVNAETAQGLGPDAFDANKPTKYTVDGTSGNLYVQQRDLYIPDQRGPAIEVARTYNSRSFDFPRLLGTGNWTISLRKYLKYGTFYRCIDPGDIEDLKVGDLLEEEPEEPDCTDLQNGLSQLQNDIAALDSRIKDIEDYIEDLEDVIKGLEDQVVILTDNLITEEYTVTVLAAMEDEWNSLNQEANWERDGKPAWMPQGDWDVYQSLGGNDGFAFGENLENARQAVDQIEYAIDDIEGNRIPAIDGGIRAWKGIKSDREGRLSDMEEAEGDLQQALTDCEGFNIGGYDEILGYQLSDGDGEGYFITSEATLAHQNSYHIRIEGNVATFKDGTQYIFGGGVGSRGEWLISEIKDRYGNTLTFNYAGGKITSVTDCVGRSITITYNGVYISEISDDTGRTVSYHYDTAGRLTKVVNPDGKETLFEYVQGPAPSYVKSSWQSPGNSPLLSKITDANGHSISFAYIYERRSYPTKTWGRTINQRKSLCTEVSRDNGIGKTNYYYGWDISAKEPPEEGNTRIEDSRGNSTRKKWETFQAEGKNETKRRLVTEIADSYGGITRYTWDSSGEEQKLGNLNQTTDTNGLVHEMTYDDMGNMLSKMEDPGGLSYPTSWGYEPNFNQVTGVTDANGNTKRYYYVGDGQGGGEGHGPEGVLWKEEDAELNVTLHWYNDFGQRTKTLDANENITEYKYEDEWGNLTRVIKHSPSEYAHDIDGVQGFEATYTYNARGNKIAETDFNGNETTYRYDVMNRLIRKIVHDGEERFFTHFFYDAVGNKTTMTDPRMNVTYYNYDSADRLVEVKEPERRTTGYTYDTESNKISETDPNGNVTTFKYDNLNRLIRKIEPLNKETRYYYGGSGDSSTDGGSREYTRRKDRYTKMTQNNNDVRRSYTTITTRYEYDILYRLERVIDALNGITQYEYDKVGNKTAEIDAELRRTEFEYYNNNWLWKIIDPMPTPGIVEYTYDGMGNKASEKDKNDHYTYYDYTTDRNLLTEITDELGGYIEYTYDGMNKRKERDKNSNITGFTYNERNLLTEALWPTGVSSTYEYDSSGNKILETDPNGNKTRLTYDGLNRMLTKTEAYGALNLTTAYSYDPVGNRTAIEDANGNITRYYYDALNRLTRVQDALSGNTYYMYDTLGNKVRTTDAEGHATNYYYDKLNRLTTVINPLGQTTSYGYDKVGNRIDQWDAKGQHIHYDYDDLNRLILRTFTGTGVTIGYVYDPVGNRTQMNESRSDLDDIVYAYDELNRLTDVNYSLTGKTIHYDYDNNGNRTLMVNPEAGETHYYYDALNRLDYLVDPDSGTTDYDYDPGSRLTDMAYPNGTTTHYEYDAANRITSMVTKNSSQAVIQSITYDEYDGVGNRLSMTDNTGTTTYSYDDLYRLASVTYPGGTTKSYTYDGVGNRLTKSIDGQVTEQYAYNAANQLVSRQVGGSGSPTKEITVSGTVSDPDNPPFSGVDSVTVNGIDATVQDDTFTADGVTLYPGENTLEATVRDIAGNTNSHSINVTYDPDMTISYDYSYDANGNLSTKTEQPSGNVTTYEYDYENRLTSVTLPDTTTNTFTYDGDKRRVSRTNAAGETTKFFYDGINILKDYDATGTELASYVQGVGIDSLISRKDTNGARYFHADALGSTRTMTDSTQFTTATYQYDAWGKVTDSTGETANEYKFTARRFEEEIGLQYNRARYYDPEIGRFTTMDPLTSGPDDPTISYQNNIYAMVYRFIEDFFNSMNPHKTNRYVYCQNNPINFIDPLGLDDEKKEAEKPQDSVEAEKSEQSQDQQKLDESKKTWADLANQNPKLSGDEKKALADGINNCKTQDELNKFAAENFEKITGKENIGLVDGSSAIKDALNKVVDALGGGIGKIGQEAHKAATGQPNELGKATDAFAKEAAGQAIKDAITGGGSKIDRGKAASERRAFWKKEAQTNPSQYSGTDLGRMKQGKAPIGSDGWSKELHHLKGTHEGGKKPLTRTDHRLGDSYRERHPWLFKDR